MDLRILHDQQLIEARLGVWLDSSSPLYQAARHIVLAPAKRLRSLLVTSASQDLGASLDSTLDPACALEFLHSYSLIHDDLPAMDDDPYRRGVPTLHTLYGDGVAILVGDFLHTLTFEVLSTSPLPPVTALELIRVLSRAAGGAGMVQGQYLDITAAADSTTINKLKTGCLFEAALHFAAILACPSRVVELARLGQEIGILFQYLDDLDDHTYLETESSAIHTACSLYTDLQMHIDSLFPSGSRTKALLTCLSASIERISRGDTSHATA